MNQVILKTEALETKVFRFNMEVEEVKKIAGSLLENEKIIDSKQVVVYNKLVKKGLLPCQNIYLNIKTDSEFEAEELLKNIMNGQIEMINAQVEFLFGLELLKALDEKQREVVIVATFNLSYDRKVALFDLLHQGHGGGSVINKKKELALLTEEEGVGYRILENLNGIADSPLKGRIMLGESRPKFAINPQTLSQTINRCPLLKRGQITDINIFTRFLVNALIAYESVFYDVYAARKQQFLNKKTDRIPLLYRR